MNKNKASGVAWVKPAEPSFLKKFKSDVGYKEGPNVDTKRQLMPALDDDSGSDREDELPQVVVLKSGDLTADEAKKMKDEKTAGDAEAPTDGKILFKKPAKRSSSDKFQGITASSSKKKRNDGGEKGEEEKKEEKSGSKIKNQSLLSFGEDEEEDED
ncbi:uncharacterized protein KIAA1143 homolog isoform X2 [Kryptolebias marmoratus]|uniref:uncharacterized protein KIAA1143 homolog isoform X2 n=1 Tax=Kryptolebias marmoratus TaxID=37003 RepID=UPI000D5305ED|nr:uncharacterized protein KIAA1143 homolog isoform X2 [Kryptolebias marmoratus]